VKDAFEPGKPLIQILFNFPGETASCEAFRRNALREPVLVISPADLNLLHTNQILKPRQKT